MLSISASEGRRAIPWHQNHRRWHFYIWLRKQHIPYGAYFSSYRQNHEMQCICSKALNPIKYTYLDRSSRLSEQINRSRMAMIIYNLWSNLWQNRLIFQVIYKKLILAVHGARLWYSCSLMIHKRVHAILLTLDDSHILVSVMHNHRDLSESLKYWKCFAFASCWQATVDKEKGGKSLLASKILT